MSLLNYDAKFPFLNQTSQNKKEGGASDSVKKTPKMAILDKKKITARGRDRICFNHVRGKGKN